MRERLTSASASLSWPTIRASEYKDTGPIGSKSHDHMLGKGYLCAVVTQDAWQTPTTNMDMVRSEEGVQKRIAFRASIGRKSIPDGNLGEQMQRVVKDAANWPTATATNRVRNEETLAKCAAFRKRNANQNTVPLYLEEVVLREEQHGLPAPANPSTDGSHPESWETPTVSTGGHRQADGSMTPKLDQHVKSWATSQQRDFKDAEPLAKWTERAEEQKAKGVNLHLPLPSQVMNTEEKSWGTPTARDHKSGRGNEEREYKELTPMVERTQSGKLNPRWVETLMGLPVGWTMPSCQMPITPCGEIILGQSMEQWPTPSADGDSRPGANADVQKWTKIRDEKKAEGINKQLLLTTKVMMEEERIQNSASPVTIEQTNCDSSETESCQPQQNELSELF